MRLVSENVKFVGLSNYFVDFLASVLLLFSRNSTVAEFLFSLYYYYSNELTSLILNFAFAELKPKLDFKFKTFIVFLKC